MTPRPIDVAVIHHYDDRRLIDNYALVIDGIELQVRDMPRIETANGGLRITLVLPVGNLTYESVPITPEATDA